MKTAFVFLLTVCLYGTTFGQLSFNIQTVSADEVPEAVQTAQTGYFPGLSVNLWEKQTASGPENMATKFVASFQGSGNQLIRARYLQVGTGLTASTYYTGKQLPSAIQSAAANNYPDYKLVAGQKVLLLGTNKSIFRIRLRNGAQKLVVYVDSNGEEISRRDVPREVLEDENEE